jgi:hypothetical protein
MQDSGLLDSPKTCKLNQAGRIYQVGDLAFRRSLGPWLPEAHVERGRCQEFASARSKCCKCDIAQISVLRRYDLSTFKARYRKPRSGDGTKFVDDYVKLARGELRLHFCGSKREYWILRRALFKYSKHLTPVTRA